MSETSETKPPKRAKRPNRQTTFFSISSCSSYLCSSFFQFFTVLSKYKTDNIPGAENVQTDCDVIDVVGETAAEDKDFVVFGDEVKEEAFADTWVDGCDVLLK